MSDILFGEGKPHEKVVHLSPEKTCSTCHRGQEALLPPCGLGRRDRMRDEGLHCWVEARPTDTDRLLAALARIEALLTPRWIDE